MIAFIEGTILAKHERSAVINVNGIGYLVFIPRPLLESINEGGEMQLFIHTNVREDDISLYGFPAQDQWQMFKLLLSVSGVGPKSAMEILSAPLQKIAQAIAKKDGAFLTRIPGIGKKTAERIIIDLEGKVKTELMEDDGAPSSRHH